VWITLFAVFVAGSLALIGLPLFRPKETWQVPGQQEELDRLLIEKARVLRTIKDLESEHRAELMDEEAYQAARTEFIAQAVQLNRRIADLTGSDPSRAEEPEFST